MLKVLVAALIGTAAGVAVMVVVIVASGSTTSNASSVGLGTLPITTASTTPPTTTAPPTTGGGTTTGGNSGGNAAAGKAIFTGSSGCSGCHTLTPAGATGTVGPNLDDITADQKAAGVPMDQFIEESITDPDKYIAKGFSQGVMPTNFGTSLSQSQIADLVALISSAQPSS
ncbi:MAG TPA: cytochrome c [Gaiellales bacterium]|jgi:cytochrome c551/c552|nr:cytochrome c [Gaiellales bacterium]